MKYLHLILVALVAVCASAFAPVATTRPTFKPLAASKLPETRETVETRNAAAVAAFATALAPVAAHAVDEATVIGYGAGLVACVVSLAVGFAIGYGTLVKL